MNIKYVSYWASRKRLNTEKGTIGKNDTVNKTNYKKKYLNNEITSEEIASNNFDDGLLFEFVVFDMIEDDYPVNYVTVRHENKHVGTHFIDPGGRKYLTYLFTEVKPKEKLFLREIWYYHFTKEDTDQEDYRMHYVFDEDGNVSVRKYDDKNQKMSDFESKEPMDTRALYEPYPEFGRYEGIIKLDREIPFLEDTIKKYFFKNGKRFYKDEDGNIIED